MRAPDDGERRPEAGPTVESPGPGGRGKAKEAGKNEGRTGGPAFDPPAVMGELGALGPYRVVNELGRGGMGAVYLAFDTRLNRKLALKAMLPRYAADKAAKERFLREARAAAQISHDNVVTVYEADERNGLPYIAMQFLKGASLEHYLIEKGEVPIQQVMRIGREAATGLAAAHKIGLVHRDIKPANLWLEAPNGRVKVLDFGLAKPMDTDVSLTTSGMIVGTPVFMSPEQARGKDVGPRSDLFSLGGVLYRLCARQLPFNGPNAMAILVALTTEEPKPLREINPEVPEALAELIHQMLAKDPEKRPANGDEVAKRLKGIGDSIAGGRAAVAGARNDVGAITEISQALHISGGDQGPSSSQLRAASKNALPHQVWIAVGIAAVIAAVAGGVVLFNMNRGDAKAVSRVGGSSKAEGRAPATEPVDAAPENSPQVTTPVAETRPTMSAAIPQTQPTVAKAVADAQKSPTTLPVARVAAAANVPEPRPVQVAKAVSTPPPAIVNDAERQVAAWVTSVGGWIQVSGSNQRFAKAAELPANQFTVSHIFLDGRGVKDADLARFKNLKGLIYINIDHNAITDAGLAQLKDLTTLQAIYAHEVGGITDKGLDELAKLKEIWSLWLGGTSVTDAVIPRLKENFPKLAYLALGATGVTDAGLSQLAEFKELTYLYLGHSSISDATVGRLARLEKLKLLYIDNCGITDVGLAQLRNAKSLTSLNLAGTKVTIRGIADFHSAVPGCQINREGLTGAIPTVATILTSPEYGWFRQSVVPVVNVGQSQADPFLTADDLEMWFASKNQAGNVDIWYSKRASPKAQWGKPVNAGRSVNTDGWESMPSLTADGLTLVFWRSAKGQFAYEASRSSKDSPWDVAVKINGTAGAISPLVSADGLELYVSLGGKIHRLTRPGRAEVWSSPALVAEFAAPTALQVRWMSQDGLTLVGWSQSNSGLEYWLSQRQARDKPWAARKRIDLYGDKPIAYPFLYQVDYDLHLYFVLDNRIQMVRRSLKPVGRGGQ
jgi:serine/threonine protein kinase